MKERPILFNAEMVRAILDGRKTMTRRVIFKDDPTNHNVWWCQDHWQDGDDILKFSYGIPGDRLWVRETWDTDVVNEEVAGIVYKATDEGCCHDGKWRSPRFMFREFSRITLEITDVRVERLQEINKERHDDILKEGWLFTVAGIGQPYKDFSILWDSINGKKYPWDSNPFVWVISFNKVT